jgi:glycosyltransferase involved in cell wall biosynthesis
VLHVITGLTYGGAEDQLVHMAAHTRHQMEVVGLDQFSQAGEILARQGIRVFNVRTPGRYDFRVIVRLARLMRHRDYDVVHVHLLRAGLHGRVAARLARVPVVVYTEHSIGRDAIEELPGSAPMRWLYRATARLADVTIAVSPWVEELIREWGVRGRTMVLENGVDLDRLRFDDSTRATARAELGIPRDATVIGTVGRMVEPKRPAVLLRAAAPLVREGAWLVLVGDGALRLALEAEAAELGIRSRTLFTGARIDVPAMLCAMDVFASLTTAEAYGLAPLEALACGLPVLVTHAPAVEEWGPPRVRWVDAEPDDVERELRRALDDRPGRMEILDQLGRYSVQRTVERLDDLYDELMASR